jgi:RNA-directed DNA polymerase
MGEAGEGAPVEMQGLMERVLDRDNLFCALKRVRANGGRPGVEGMTVQALPAHLKRHGPPIRNERLAGTYRPQPVRRVDIPKPGGGGRPLGLPTVLDRLIQQALLQVLQADWDSSFSAHSDGFRPGRSAHPAVVQAQEYLGAGYGGVVDLDLEKFFDRLNHDKLMSSVKDESRTGGCSSSSTVTSRQAC